MLRPRRSADSTSKHSPPVGSPQLIHFGALAVAGAVLFAKSGGAERSTLERPTLG